MMHCHVCDEDVPLTEIVNHVRLFHPDAYPVAEHVEIHVHQQQPITLDAQAIYKAIQRQLPRGRHG